MANTNATNYWRAKWFSDMLQETLHAALVAEKICQVDNGDQFYIWNPYPTAPTTTIQSISGGSQGTYSVSTYTTTNDTLTITDEFYTSLHIYDFERVMAQTGLRDSLYMEMVASVATAIDRWVINKLCDAGTGTYSTPAGGFSQANVPVIFSNIASKLAGYANPLGGQYIVVEQQDLPGIIQAGAAQGFSFADMWLKNGLLGSYMGIDIYVKVNSTFASTTLGSLTVTNSGHRVAGVKGITTYASPRGIHYEEKPVTGKTGQEIVVYGYLGAAVWAAKAALTIDITVSA